MSDLLTLHEDTIAGDSKRYTKEISIGDAAYEVTYRQARDGEMTPFHSVVDEEEREKWEEVQSEVDTDDMAEEDLKRLQKLQTKQQNGRLSDDEQDELESLREETKGMQKLMQLIISNEETVAALKEVAKTVVVPDEDDIDDILGMTPDTQQERFGAYATDEESAKELYNDTILPEIVERSTNYSSVALGLQGVFIGQSGDNDPN